MDAATVQQQLWDCFASPFDMLYLGPEQALNISALAAALSFVRNNTSTEFSPPDPVWPPLHLSVAQPYSPFPRTQV
jgi:hypothetical protein